ncbi:MAG: hypothetical protein CMB99_02510 [Flavobacteriaceae bacterium]|nr:hypothetical protein [Flavobacteriaceae bacterium]|tara:strand:+ start:68957 stop:69577 length:621 start_codon:yes stop_codon:yes gene_type:complete
MVFYQKGKKKPSNEPDAVSGCLLIIGFGAIVFLFSMMEDLDDLLEYIWQILIALFIGIGFVVSMFQKKGHISNQNVIVKNGKLKIEKIATPLEEIIIDHYQQDGTFKRYHLRDKAGKIAVFSIDQDDLLAYFKENHPDQVQSLKYKDHMHDGPYVSLIAEEQKLYYNLDSGEYKIVKPDNSEISYLPLVYTYDPQYKLGKALFKRR